MGGNPNPKTDHLKKTQFKKLPTGKQLAMNSKGGKKSQQVQREKKEELKENQKFADIFNIIFNSEVDTEAVKQQIKEKYPEIDPTHKVVMAMETRARMFKTIKEYDDKGEVIATHRVMKDRDFLAYQEYIRDTIGEKPVDKIAQTNSEGEDIVFDNERMKLIKNKIKKKVKKKVKKKNT